MINTDSTNYEQLYYKYKSKYLNLSDKMKGGCDRRVDNMADNMKESDDKYSNLSNNMKGGWYTTFNHIVTEAKESNDNFFEFEIIKHDINLQEVLSAITYKESQLDESKVRLNKLEHERNVAGYRNISGKDENGIDPFRANYADEVLVRGTPVDNDEMNSYVDYTFELQRRMIVIYATELTIKCLYRDIKNYELSIEKQKENLISVERMVSYYEKSKRELNKKN